VERAQLVEEYDAYYTANPGKWAAVARVKFAWKATRHLAPTSILDVGCGNGHALEYFKGRYPEADLFGIDLSPVACDLAYKRSGAHIENVFIEDYRPGRKFDLVLCLGTAEHFTDPLAGLQAIRELVGGRFYLEIPNCLSYSPGEDGYRRLAFGSRQMEWHWPRSRWEKAIKEAGFAIEESLVGLSPSWEFVWILR
jgi:SAM-dependent methyltransferase